MEKSPSSTTALTGWVPLLAKKGAEEVAAWKEAASWRHRDDDSEKHG